MADLRPGERAPRVLYAANVASFFAKFLKPYGRHFRGLGWQVDALSKGFKDLPGTKFADDFDELHEIDWARKPHQLRHTAQIVRGIRQVVNQNHYDIVHVHTPVAAMMTRYALRRRDRSRTKLFYTAHGFHFFVGAPRATKQIYKGIESVAGRWTDFLVVMNEEDHRAAMQIKSLPKERIVLMPGIGLDLSRYSPNPDACREVRSELGLCPGDVVFLCVAEFIPRKRQDDILYALGRLNEPSVRVLFAGDGETMPANKLLAASLGLTSQVTFLGLRRDVPRLLAASDGFVLPSSQEGLPRSVMEAMCCGVPVIATDIRGSRDLLSGGAGTLYPVGDVAALAAAMKSLVRRPDDYRPAALEGMLRVQRYDLRNLIRLHEELYASALGLDCDSLSFNNSVKRGYVL